MTTNCPPFDVRIQSFFNNSWNELHRFHCQKLRTGTCFRYCKTGLLACVGQFRIVVTVPDSYQWNDCNSVVAKLSFDFGHQVEEHEVVFIRKDDTESKSIHGAQVLHRAENGGYEGIIETISLHDPSCEPSQFEIATFHFKDLKPDSKDSLGVKKPSEFQGRVRINLIPSITELGACMTSRPMQALNFEKRASNETLRKHGLTLEVGIERCSSSTGYVTPNYKVKTGSESRQYNFFFFYRRELPPGAKVLDFDHHFDRNNESSVSTNSNNASKEDTAVEETVAQPSPDSASDTLCVLPRTKRRRLSDTYASQVILDTEGGQYRSRTNSSVSTEGLTNTTDGSGATERTEGPIPDLALFEQKQQTVQIHFSEAVKLATEIHNNRRSKAEIDLSIQNVKTEIRKMKRNLQELQGLSDEYGAKMDEGLKTLRDIEDRSSTHLRAAFRLLESTNMIRQEETL